jgi:hypothetical protein
MYRELSRLKAFLSDSTLLHQQCRSRFVVMEDGQEKAVSTRSGHHRRGAKEWKIGICQRRREQAHASALLKERQSRLSTQTGFLAVLLDHRLTNKRTRESWSGARLRSMGADNADERTDSAVR